jgi:hypothetical protein
LDLNFNEIELCYNLELYSDLNFLKIFEYVVLKGFFLAKSEWMGLLGSDLFYVKNKF